MQRSVCENPTYPVGDSVHVGGNSQSTFMLRRSPMSFRCLHVSSSDFPWRA